MGILLIAVTINDLLIGYGHVGPAYPGAPGPYHGPYPVLFDSELGFEGKLTMILFDWVVYAIVITGFMWAGFAIMWLAGWAIKPR